MGRASIADVALNARSVLLQGPRGGMRPEISDKAGRVVPI